MVDYMVACEQRYLDKYPNDPQRFSIAEYRIECQDKWSRIRSEADSDPEYREDEQDYIACAKEWHDHGRTFP